MHKPERLIGMPVNQADAILIASGKSLRVIGEDGEDFAFTLDFNPDRLNVKIEDGRVIALDGWG